MASAYYSAGARNWRYSNLLINAMGKNAVLATVDWDMRGEDFNTLKNWRHSYVVTVAKSNMGILAAIYTET
jgi:hypothetical protein